MIDSGNFQSTFNLRFHGRLSRTGYFMGLLIARGFTSFSPDFLGPFANGVALAFFCLGKFLLATLVVKRLHDLGASGWWAAPLVIPPALFGAGVSAMAMANPVAAAGLVNRIDGDALLFVSLVFVAVSVALGLFPGQRRDNRFGPDPKGLVGRTPPGLHPPY